MFEQRQMVVLCIASVVLCFLITGCGSPSSDPPVTMAITESEVLSPLSTPTEAFLSPELPTATQSPPTNISTQPVPLSDVTPTPFLIEEALADGSCVERSADVRLPGFSSDSGIFSDAEIEEIRNYLNEGGSTGELAKMLLERGNAFGPDLSQLVVQDVTGDGIPEIFMAVTSAYTESGFGESQLDMFQCVGGQYALTLLFRRAGAGSRADGLYGGGGVRILRIQDLNGNGIPEVLFSTNWQISSSTYSEIYVYEWQGMEFRSLVEFNNDLGETQYRIDVEIDRRLIVEDIDGDGIMELISEDGIVYDWNETSYAPESN